MAREPPPERHSAIPARGGSDAPVPTTLGSGPPGTGCPDSGTGAPMDAASNTGVTSVAAVTSVIATSGAGSAGRVSPGAPEGCYLARLTGVTWST